MEKVRNTYKIKSDILKRREHLEDLVVDGKLVIKWTLMTACECGT